MGKIPMDSPPLECICTIGRHIHLKTDLNNDQPNWWTCTFKNISIENKTRYSPVLGRIRPIGRHVCLLKQLVSIISYQIDDHGIWNIFFHQQKFPRYLSVISCVFPIVVHTCLLKQLIWIINNPIGDHSSICGRSYSFIWNIHLLVQLDTNLCTSFPHLQITDYYIMRPKFVTWSLFFTLEDFLLWS